MGKSTRRQSFFYFLVVFTLGTLAAQAQVTGRVFRDFNANGTQDTPISSTAVSAGEPGVQGVVITAYPVAGSPLSATTDISGIYSFANTGITAAGAKLRLEFTNFPTGYASGPQATATGGSGTTEQFVTASSSTTANYGINYPADYCQTNPKWATGCYVNGVATGTDAALIVGNYNFSGLSSTTPDTKAATTNDIGSTWGLAYAKKSKLLFAATYLKRHVGMGDGPGFVYYFNFSGSTTPTASAGKFDLQGVTPANGGSTIDLGTVCRTASCTTTGGTSASFVLGAAGAQNIDYDAFTKVGTISYGDADVDEATGKLWLVNLYQKALISVDISGNTLPGTVNQYPLSNIPGFPACASGTARPFALAFRKGVGYVGIVCDAGTSQNKADLHAYVFSFDPANPAAGLTSVLDFNLGYKLLTQIGGYSWNAWLETPINGSILPQPMLTDIEFAPDNSMILGLRDRWGDQQGPGNLQPNGATALNSIAAGDILKACYVNGAWIMEGLPGGCPVTATAGGTGVNANGEFFKDTRADTWDEGAEGGLALLPGSGEVVTTFIDPWDGVTPSNNSTYQNGQGLQYFSTATGTITDYYQIYRLASPFLPLYGKADGLSDLLFLCDPAPIEIGNRVWLDKNKDGLQSPDETPIPGITVQLFAAGGTTPLATTVTDGNGLYVFKSTSTTALTYNTAYEVRIATAQTALTSLSFTTGNQGGNDGIDSDFTPGATAAVASLTTGDIGQNVHSYDAGLICDAPTLADMTSQTICQGSTFALPLSATVSSGTATGYQWYFTDATGTSFTAITGATSATFSPIATQQPAAAGGVRYYSVSAYNSTSLCADNAFVSLTIKPTQTVTFTVPALATVTQCANTTINLSVSTNAKGPDQIRFVYFDSPTADPYVGGTPLGLVTSTTATGTKTVSLIGAQLPDNISTASSTIYVYAILVSADGVCKPADDAVIVLKPRPTPGISGNPILCQGTSATLTASGPPGTTFQWFLNNATTSASSLNPYITPAISTTTTYRVRATLSTCVSDDASITLNPVPCTPCTASPTAIGGTAFRDFNSNGLDEANDPGLSNVTVTIFNCDASGASTQVATMLTDINGSYSFTGLTAGTTYRVEFSGYPAGYEPTFRGTSNGTTVQFTQPGSCTSSLGLNQPADFCQANPRLITSCYIDGAVTPNVTGLSDALVSFDYIINSSPTANKSTDGNRVDIGSTWGLAYARSTKKLYAASFLKRHIGLKDGKLGQIYVKDYTNPSAAPTPWLDVSTLGLAGNWTYLSDATRGLGNSGSPSLDADAFDKIATVGLGDIDISDDDKTLYAMDLINRQLLAIDVATKTLIGKYPVPEICTSTAGPIYFTAASAPFTATDGKVWNKGIVFDSDNNALTYAQTITNPNSASAGTTDAALYATSAYTSTSMSYGFPMGNGTYGVKMHFATNISITNRNTTVLAEGIPVISGLDVYAVSANQVNLGLTRSFTATVTDGVLSINTVNGAGSSFAAISGFEITPLSGQATGITRPFATKFHNGKVYVGAVCDASQSQNVNDLQASIFEFDPTTSTYSATPKLTFPLNYKKGSSVGASTNGSNNSWMPWTSVYPNNTTSGIQYIYAVNFDVYTQPVLSDIEFDTDGSMILGFFDRFGNQIGATPNYRPDRPTSAGLTSGYSVVGGDILRAYNNNGSYQIEGNAKEGISSFKPATSGQNNLQGPGGGEFYVGDALPEVHNETSMGGLAMLPGSGEIRLTSGDPLALGSGGELALDNTTGAKIVANSITLYSGAGGGVQYKANGLGDLELACNVAPIQIGNRVWRDDNKNGIQDPCEPAIPGAVVKLYDATKTTIIASVTTNAAGEYYFSSSTVVAGTSTSSVSTSLLTYNTTYGLVITSLGTSTVVTSAGLSLTDVSPLTPGESGSINSGLTQINNDAKVDVVGVQSLPCIKLTTGGPGESNHTYDFGLVKFVCSLTATASTSSPTVCTGQPITLTTQVSPVGSYTYAWAGPNGVTFTPTNTSTVTATGLSTGLQTFTVTVSSLPTCFTTATVSVSVASCVCQVSLNPVVPIQSACNSNNTFAEATDDYFTVTVNPTAVNGGASGKYEVVVGGVVLNPGGTAYGTAATVGSPTTFKADGSTTYLVTVRDLTSPTCLTTFTTKVVQSCSVCPPQLCIPITGLKQ